MRRTVIALALAAVVAGGGPAWAQRYEALTSDSERLQQLVDEIRDLIDEVERARAADARFVRDVRAVLGRYDNPWRVPLVAEDFRDGDFTRNPAWAVHGGEYFVSLRDGLHSRADASRLALTPPRPRRTQESPRDTAADILGRIISEALREDEEDDRRRQRHGSIFRCVLQVLSNWPRSSKPPIRGPLSNSPSTVAPRTPMDTASSSPRALESTSYGNWAATSRFFKASRIPAFSRAAERTRSSGRGVPTA